MIGSPCPESDLDLPIPYRLTIAPFIEIRSPALTFGLENDRSEMQKSLPFPSPAPIPALSNFHFKRPNPSPAKSILNPINSTTNPRQKNDNNISLIPAMPEIMAASKAQNLNLQLQTLGPLFRVSARSLETGQELGRAEGLVRVWFGGRILHLDSMRMRRETLGMEKSIFGLGLFVGAVAVRHGFDCGCRKAELLAINDTELYHSKGRKRDNMPQQLITICENARFMLGTRKRLLRGWDDGK